MDSTSIQFRSHTALLLAAAIPYLQPAYRLPTELAMKLMEFMETIKLYRELPESPLHNASGSPVGESGILAIISRFIQDLEGLLQNLSGVCSGKEKEVVTLLLNFLQAKSFYENYGDILGSFMSADLSANPFASETPPTTDNIVPESFSVPDMASVLAGGDLSSMLSQEQTDTLNLLKNLLDAE